MVTGDPLASRGGDTAGGAGTVRMLAQLADRIATGDIPDDALAAAVVAVAELILDEARRTPRFRRALQGALRTAAGDAPRAEREPRGARRRGGRRSPGLVDPYEVLDSRGVDGLRQALRSLNADELKDVIAQHGMDRDRLALKWKDRERLISRIVGTAVSRATKGDAFRGNDASRAVGEV